MNSGCCRRCCFLLASFAFAPFAGRLVRRAGTGRRCGSSVGGFVPKSALIAVRALSFLMMFAELDSLRLMRPLLVGITRRVPRRMFR